MTELAAVKILGTKKWRAKVPPHLQEPLAQALHYMEANDVAEACKWFGETMNLCQNEDEAKPVLFFAAQVAGHRWLELRGAAPDHPHIKEWRDLTNLVLRGAVEMHPNDPVPRHNLGRFLQDCNENEEALNTYRRTVMLDPTQVETWGNMGDLYYWKGDRETAYECWERCVSLPTDKASGRLSQAYFWLRTGQYEKGWAAFNDRWKDMVFVRGYGRDKELGGKHWMGEKLNSKKHSLLLHGEQGLGDHVQFARYIPALRDLGITIAGLETRGSLARWMAAAFPDVLIVERDKDERPTFTHHCSTMDLPGILGTTLETIPPPVAPLPPHSDEFRAIWKLPDTLLVGIAWEGARGNTADYYRSIPQEQLRHLADIPGVTWVNLQFNQDSAIIGRSWLGKNFVDGTEGCTDTLDTAAVMRGLDLIVTVDTLTLHLAGTLGVPTLALHRFVREWRWLDSGEANQWYPSVTNLTCTSPHGWDDLLLRVRHELEEKAK